MARGICLIWDSQFSLKGLKIGPSFLLVECDDSLQSTGVDSIRLKMHAGERMKEC